MGVWESPLQGNPGAWIALHTKVELVIGAGVVPPARVVPTAVLRADCELKAGFSYCVEQEGVCLEVFERVRIQ